MNNSLLLIIEESYLQTFLHSLYLEALDEQDGYTLAIRFMLHATIRVGEVKGLLKTDYDEHFFYVRQQLVDEHEFEVTQDGATMGKRYRRIKDPKGNANYSIRPIELTPYNRNIIEQMLALHEPSPYLFTCQGRPLITDTFNKRLKKYTAEIGIPYLSTHKLRFTSASLAKNQGQCEQDIQHNLGHSNIQQTQHYDSHATTEYNYGMAADIYDKKYNVTKCNQTFEHKENRGRYLSKYFGKDLDLKEHKKKAFFKSQNLKVPHETKVMLTEDILHDLQKENIVFQKEYTRQIYDTNAFLSTGSCLKDSSVIYIKIKKENPCVKGESYG